MRQTELQKQFESQKEQRVMALQKSLSNGKKSLQPGFESDSEDSDLDTPSVRLLLDAICIVTISCSVITRCQADRTRT